VIDVLIIAPLAPEACARPRAAARGGLVQVYLPAQTRRWQTQFAAVALEYLPRGRIEEPLRLDVLAVLARPQRLRRRADPVGLIWAPVRPDADNIGKNIMDALAFALRDDGQIVQLSVLKAYAELGQEPRVEARLRSVELTADEAWRKTT
jgi:Holliday junction resolvase RusA-like endonuclease